MGLVLEEQEVNIGFTRVDEVCQLYASDSKWITKMDKLCEKNPEQFKKVAQTKHGCTYEFPKKFLTIRSKDRKMTLSDEQRKQRSEFAKLRFTRKSDAF